MSLNNGGGTPLGQRIQALDFLRGLAILGILIINIESFAYSQPWSPYQYGFDSELDTQVRFWVYFLAQGKFWGMLSILFGAGFYLFLARLDEKQLGSQAMDIYARRLLWLFLIGVAHAYLIWDGDILYHYAICGFLLFPFRSFSPKKLLLVLCVPLSVMLFNSLDRVSDTKERYEHYLTLKAKDTTELTRSQRNTLDRWERRHSPKGPVVDKDSSSRTSLWQSVLENADKTQVHKGKIFYQSILFPTLMLMIIGVLFCKLGIFRDYRSLKHYWPITLTLLSVALAINYLRYQHWSFAYFEPVTTLWRGAVHTFPREILAVAYVLFFNGLYQKFLRSKYLYAIECVGRMALTNYLLQSVICGLVFYGYGLNYFNQLPRSQLLVIIPFIWLGLMLFSWIWVKKIGTGPIEKWWRNRTYPASSKAQE